MILVVAATPPELRWAAHGAAVGVGPVEAAIATARVLAEQQPAAVLHVGLAGARRASGIRDRHSRCSARPRVYCDLVAAFPGLVREVEPDAALLARARSALPEARALPIGTSAAVGGTTGTDVEAMEGFAVLRACALAGVPAVELRVVANEIEEEDRARWDFRAPSPAWRTRAGGSSQRSRAERIAVTSAPATGRCSGFMSTLRSTVTVSTSGSSHGCRWASQLASTRSLATCQPSSASRSNPASHAAVTSLARGRRGNGQTMSRSGGTTSGRSSPAAAANASAAERAAPTTEPSPSRSRAKHAQRRPQRGGGGTGPRALQADLAEVQVARREVRVRRVVAVQAADAGVAEQHGAAAVGLEAVLVRVDDDGVGAPHGVERRAAHARLAAVREQREEAAVRRVDVQARTVARAQLGDRVDRVDHAEARRAERRHDRAHAALGQAGLERLELEPPVAVLRHAARGARRAPRTCARACSGRSRPTR